MVTVTLFRNLVDNHTYRTLDGVTVERKSMLTHEWEACSRDIRDVRNQSVSENITIAGSNDGEDLSTVTRPWWMVLLRRVFHVKS